MKGVKKVVADRRQCRRRHRRHLVERQDRARSLADRVGRRPECQGLQRDHRRYAQGRPRCRPGHRRQPGRRHQSGARRRGEEGRGGLRLSLPAPRHPGAAERHRALHPGQVRGVGLGAGRRAGARRDRGSRRHPGHQMRGLQDLPRRRVRPSRDLGRLRAAGGPRRQGDARHAGQAPVDARRGHDPRLVPSDHPVQDDRRVRRQEEPDRPAHPHLRPVDPRDGGARPHAERHGSRDLRRLLQGRRGGGVRLRRAEPPDRPCDAQSARSRPGSGGA